MVAALTASGAATTRAAVRWRRRGLRHIRAEITCKSYTLPLYISARAFRDRCGRCGRLSQIDLGFFFPIMPVGVAIHAVTEIPSLVVKSGQRLFDKCPISNLVAFRFEDGHHHVGPRLPVQNASPVVLESQVLDRALFDALASLDRRALVIGVIAFGL